MLLTIFYPQLSVNQTINSGQYYLIDFDDPGGKSSVDMSVRATNQGATNAIYVADGANHNASFLGSSTGPSHFRPYRLSPSSSIATNAHFGKIPVFGLTRNLGIFEPP